MYGEYSKQPKEFHFFFLCSSYLLFPPNREREIKQIDYRDIRMPRRNCRPVSWVMEEVVR